MYLRYAEPYELSEDELKKQIVLSIQDIVETWPEHFECDLQAIPQVETDTPLFISRMSDIPALANIRTAMMTNAPLRALRIIFRYFTIIRWACEVESRLLGIMSLTYSSQFLGIRYLVAADMIERVLGEDLIYDFNKISDYLLSSYGQDGNETDSLCAIAAEEEIGRIRANSETNERFLDVIARFEDNVEAQIKKALPDVFVEISYRLLIEAIVTSAGIIDEEIGETEKIDLKFFQDLLGKFFRKGQRFTNERLGIKRGGPRTTGKFVWTDDRKREFYETVQSLVYKDGKPIWDLAYKELTDKDFSFRIVDFLRNETALKEVPNEIWNRAIKAWKGHTSSLLRLESDKTPEAFAMFHAIYLLEFPKPAFSTMKRYFGQGKSLSIANTDA